MNIGLVPVSWHFMPDGEIFLT